MRDILDLHTHTLASGHAYNTIWEMAAGAAEKGIQLLGITEHAPDMPGSCREIYFSNLRVVPRELYGVELLMGVELNILDEYGTIDLSQNLLEEMDLAIASLHTPCIRPGSCRENTGACVNAMKNPYIHILGHPDDGRYPVDYEELVRAAKEYHVLLEINNNSLNPAGFRQNAAPNDRIMMEFCEKHGVSVLMSSDAHIRNDVGNHVRAVKLIEEAGFPEELVVNRSIKELKKYINSGR